MKFNSKKILSKLIVLTLLGWTFSQCTYENFEDKFGDVPVDCDTTAVSYSATVAPLMAEFCVACHGSSAPSGGLDLSIYSGVKSAADNGSLVGRITLPDTDPLKMPPGNNMGDCNINIISAWVNQGAQNN
ncbi:MAG: hypothetical protein SchgKO_19810 [Schleiferiaceae bacterium]